MPRVPRYDNLRVTPTPISRTAIEVPDVGGAQARQFGQAVMQAGQAATRIEVDLAREANALRVDDAVNRAKEAALRLTWDPERGFTTIKGQAALERESGKPLADEYGEALDAELEQIGASLGNDAQRLAFSARAREIAGSFRGQIMRHESEEFRNYTLSVREGTIDRSMREIALDYANPEATSAAIDSIRAAVYDAARLQGHSAEWGEAQVRKAVSRAHRQAMAGALESNNVLFAEAYLQKHAEQMNADDILAVRGAISKAMDGRVAVQVATAVARDFLPRFTSPDLDRAWRVAVQSESGGQHFRPDGSVTTSPKGAVGIAQVMPKTAPEAARLAGLEWDEERYRNDPSYNEALGKAYFERQLKDFGGDLAKAWAAYNAGPGAVRNAVKAARAAGDEGNWLALLPEETRNYVAKNAKAYGAGGGRHAPPTLAEMRNAVIERLGPEVPPERLSLALTEVERQHKLIKDAITQRDNEAVATAIDALDANGGQYAALPASVRAAIPPEKRGSIREYAKKVAGGETVTDPNIYYALSIAAAEDPKFTTTDLRPFFDRLSPADRKHFIDLQAKLGAGGEEAASVVTLAQQISAAVKMLELDSEDAGVFMDQAYRAIAAAQAEKPGKRLTAEERQAVIDRLVQPGKLPGWLWSSNTRRFKAQAEGKASEFTPTWTDLQVSEARAALQRRGLKNPTAEQIDAVLRAVHGEG